MGRLREYDIAFVGLKPGVHLYEYEITPVFFEEFQQTDFSSCTIQLKVFLDKKEALLQLKFEVGGTIETTCDRCGNDLTVSLWDEFKLFIKMIDNPDAMNEQEEDPDIFYISRTESHINIAKWIYEFINLSIPIQKICSPTPDGAEGCNEAALSILKGMEPEKDTEKDTPPNPIWKGLDKFKNLDN